jgi:hypothetical protein
MSVAVTYGFTATTVETLATNVPAASSPQVTHSGYNTSGTINGTSTVPATQCAYFSKALSSGAATIDLTALTGTNGATVDLTGLKVQIARFKNPAANANSITVTFGASNPYLLGGSAWKVILAPGQQVMFFGNDAAPDVDSTHKTIDIAGTGSQALEVSIIAG